MSLHLPAYLSPVSPHFSVSPCVFPSSCVSLSPHLPCLLISLCLPISPCLPIFLLAMIQFPLTSSCLCTGPWSHNFLLARPLQLHWNILPKPLPHSPPCLGPIHSAADSPSPPENAQMSTTSASLPVTPLGFLQPIHTGCGHSISEGPLKAPLTG